MNDQHNAALLATLERAQLGEDTVIKFPPLAGIGGVGVNGSQNRTSNWTEEETSTLLDILASPDVRSSLEPDTHGFVSRNRHIYELVSERLAELGYERPTESIKFRVQNLKSSFRKAVNGRRGNCSGHALAKVWDKLVYLWGHQVENNVQYRYSTPTLHPSTSNLLARLTGSGCGSTLLQGQATSPRLGLLPSQPQLTDMPQIAIDQGESSAEGYHQVLTPAGAVTPATQGAQDPKSEPVISSPDNETGGSADNSAQNSSRPASGQNQATTEDYYFNINVDPDEFDTVKQEPIDIVDSYQQNDDENGLAIAAQHGVTSNDGSAAADLTSIEGGISAEEDDGMTTPADDSDGTENGLARVDATVTGGINPDTLQEQKGYGTETQQHTPVVSGLSRTGLLRSQPMRRGKGFNFETNPTSSRSSISPYTTIRPTNRVVGRSPGRTRTTHLIQPPPNATGETTVAEALGQYLKAAVGNAPKAAGHSPTGSTPPGVAGNIQKDLKAFIATYERVEAEKLAFWRHTEKTRIAHETRLAREAAEREDRRRDEDRKHQLELVMAMTGAVAKAVDDLKCLLTSPILQGMGEESEEQNEGQEVNEEPYDEEMHVDPGGTA